ncbi:T2AG factor, partial [Bucco capensis]|nr:T2AG factor [Bucco capensis]
MAYQLYRNTTLGNSLQESLDELIQLYFLLFLGCILSKMSLVFLKGSLNTYRFCDNVWTFVLNDVEFREVTELVKVDKVKIVACDGKNTGSNTAE